MKLKDALLSAAVVLAVTAAMAQTPETPPAPPAPAPAPTPAPEAAPAPPAEAPNPDLERAKEAFRKGAYQQALEAGKVVISTLPNEMNALYIVGVSAVRLGRLAEAEPALKHLLEIEPNYPNIHFHLGHLAYAKGEEFGKEGRTDEAKASYVEAAREFGEEIAREPGEVQSLKARALALGRAGDIEGAIQAYEATITASPDTVSSYLALGSLFAELGRGQDAIALLDRIPKQNAKAIQDGVFAIVRTLYSKERYEETLTFAQKMIDYGLDSRPLHGLLSATYARMGSLKSCAEELCKFMSQDPPPEESSSLGEVIKLAFGGDWAEEKGPKLAPKGTRMPEVEKKYSARYPDQARKDRIETTIMLMVLVKQDGSIGQTCTVPSAILKNLREYGLEQAAVDNVKRWRFKPGSADGIPVDAWYPASVVFSLR